MIDDLDLESDVARLQEKWFGAEAEPRRALDAEEEAIAARWLGKDEASRLARTTGSRKYRPPVVVVHWGYVPLMETQDWSSTVIGDYWYVETFAGGKKHEVFRGDFDGCMRTIAKFERMGLQITRNGNDAPPQVQRAADRASAKSKRFEVLQSLRGFRRAE